MDQLKWWQSFVQRTAECSRNSSRVCLVFFAALQLLYGCNRTSYEAGADSASYQVIRLPDVTLTNQYGERVPLAALKGKPAFYDFIYTNCPGPCQLLTEHMKLIADKLGPDLGPKVSFVSVTVDPGHDRPRRLFDYARAFGANVKGWYFLTGSSSEIDEVMRAFQLGRSVESNDELDHVLGYFLVGPDCREVVDFSQHVDPAKAARAAEEAAATTSPF
jgi:protein SCO1